MSALYSYNTAPTAIMTAGGFLVPAHHSFAQPAPLIDASNPYAAQLASASPFAQDVAASVASLTNSPFSTAQYQTATAAIQAAPQHHLAAAHPGYTATYQTAGIPGAAYHAAPGYAAVSALQPPLATTPNPAYAQLQAQLQAGDRLGLANQ